MRPVVVFLGEVDPWKESEELAQPIVKQQKDCKGANIQARLNINFEQDLQSIHRFSNEELSVQKFKSLHEQIGGAKMFALHLNSDPAVGSIFRGLPVLSLDVLAQNPFYLVQLGV